jgi:hypothetical protein
MKKHLFHALTLRLAEIPTKDAASLSEEVLGYFPTKRELQCSIQCLHDSGLLVLTEDGYVPTDVAKTISSQNIQERYSRRSISDLAIKLEERDRIYDQTR